MNLHEYNLTTGTTALVSTDGTSIADVYNGGVSVSADGRFIAYQSRVVETAANDPNAADINNVVVRDMDGAAITLASVDTDDTGGGNQDSLFLSYLSPLGTQPVQRPGDTDPQCRRPLRGFRQSGDQSGAGPDQRPERLPARPDQRHHHSDRCRRRRHRPGRRAGGIISPNGQYVAFMSDQNLLPQVTGFQENVYVYDTATRALSLASVNPAGTAGGNGDSGFTINAVAYQVGGLVFSADSSSLSFESTATNLTAGVATAKENLYLRNLTAGTTTLLTPDQAGTDGGNGNVANVPALSANGQVVAFASTASNLLASDRNGQPDVFVRDVKAATTALASVVSPLLPAAFTAANGSTLGSVSPTAIWWPSRTSSVSG